MFHIVFNINENYAKYCAVVIASIIQATKYNGGGGAKPFLHFPYFIR